jgi:hypothetical protein
MTTDFEETPVIWALFLRFQKKAKKLKVVWYVPYIV